jgi:hypothetical protein
MNDETKTQPKVEVETVKADSLDEVFAAIKKSVAERDEYKDMRPMNVRINGHADEFLSITITLASPKGMAKSTDIIAGCGPKKEEPCKAK